METTALEKWNKEKLIQEILKLRENKRTLLSSSLQQCEIDELRRDVELYKEKAALIEQENKEQQNLVISDSTFKFVKQSDISSETAIHSYPSATINEVNSTIDSYSTGTKSESLIFHLGHNSIDQGTDGKKAAD